MPDDISRRKYLAIAGGIGFAGCSQQETGYQGITATEGEPTPSPEESGAQPVKTESQQSEGSVEVVSNDGLELSWEGEKQTSGHDREYFSVTNRRDERIHGAALRIHGPRPSPSWRFIYDLGSSERREYFVESFNRSRIEATSYIWTESGQPFPPETDVQGAPVVPNDAIDPYFSRPLYEYPAPASFDGSDIRQVSGGIASEVPTPIKRDIHEVSFSVENESIHGDWNTYIDGQSDGIIPAHWEFWGEVTVTSLEKEETVTVGAENIPSPSFTSLDVAVNDTTSDFKIDTIEGELESEMPITHGRVLVVARDPVFANSITDGGCDVYDSFGEERAKSRCVNRVPGSVTLEPGEDEDFLQQSQSFTVTLDKSIQLPLPDPSEIVLLFQSGYSILATETISVSSYISN